MIIITAAVLILMVVLAVKLRSARKDIAELERIYKEDMGFD